jgi:hypothetical protein
VAGQRDTLIDDDVFGSLIENDSAARVGGRRTKIIIVSTVACLAVAAIIGAWPGVTHSVSSAVKKARTGMTVAAPTGNATASTSAPAPQHLPSSAATPSARFPRLPVGPKAGGVADPGANFPVLPPGPVYAPAPAPVVRQRSAVSRPRVTSSAAPVRSAAPPPPVTWVHTEVTGPGGVCCSASSGTWNFHDGGGAPGTPGFYWTSDTVDKSAQYDWSLGNPSGGLRWDRVRVRVWIPGSYAGATVKYTVTTTYNGNRRVSSMQLTQDRYGTPRAEWVSLGVFSIGTATKRLGSIWVHLSYVSSYYNPNDAACPNGNCSAMAAAQVQFAWS